ncbi:hypothetical protein P872_09590 [Rhodonellum psychrophilum GCM71 = DSM 17998]|uniref:Uncharacterized protein n=1 Tax=Rhodonellum psychrophilum GCM71 = DSM 17998 TaxID=1123057 RepID=U5BU22_9BACT|nr:hypothetical protein P872_09590 [Rhodonellum psychrophilum GCM71 = DSM 17998]
MEGKEDYNYRKLTMLFFQITPHTPWRKDQNILLNKIFG